MDCRLHASRWSRADTDVHLVLATLPPTQAQTRLTYAVMALATVAFVATVPFAQVPLATAPAFLLVAQTILVLCDLITVLKLMSQFEILKWPALLALANGYLFSAGMATLHVASFPEYGMSSMVTNAATQTTAWLYFLWHSGFPLFILAYALLATRESRFRAWHPSRWHIALALLPSVALVAAFGLLLMTANDWLPTLMQGNDDAGGKVLVAMTTWALIFIAFVALWRKPRRSVLDLALLVVLLGWSFDVGLAAVFNHGRYDVGWYAGRVFGTVAATFVLAVLLVEHTRLYSRLAEAHVRERRSHALAEQRSDELKALNKELEAFSYSVSHDLRAPLRAVIGYARMLEEDCEEQLNAEGKRLLSVVRDEAARMGLLIDDLLEFSRLGRKPISSDTVAMTALVRDQCERILQGLSEPLPVIEVAELPPTTGDRALLERVWANLIGNAVKFSSSKESPRVRITGQRVADEIVYEVEDNGVGFDMAYAQKLFGVFQRLHTQDEFPGTGVGLAIVQRIVNRHGGRIWAVGRPGLGATFGFALPCQEAS